MADKRISMRKLLLTGPLSPENLLHSPATAAEQLGVAEKYVFDLIKRGHLERVVITDQKGREIGRGITYDSVRAFARYERKNKKQRRLDLPLPQP